MRIEYAMKSAPQSEAELLAIYKGSHGRLRGVPPPIIAKTAEPEIAQVKDAEPILVPIVKKEKSYRKWSFVVDEGQFGRKTIAETPAPSIAHIKNVVSVKYGVGVLDMISKQRTLHICRARHIAAYLCATMARRSLPSIGLQFGDRDHTTILHSRDKIAQMMVADEDFEKEIHDLRRVILDTYREVAPGAAA